MFFISGCLFGFVDLGFDEVGFQEIPELYLVFHSAMSDNYYIASCF